MNIRTLHDEPIEVFLAGLVIGGCIATAFILIIWGVS